MPEVKKLIEVALPLEAINAESAREKSIRHGHPSTLHLWWARRPLATARAVIWSSLVDDPSSHPEQFPTEEEQNAERERLFGILTRLVKWENSNDEAILAEAKQEILRCTHGHPPALLDPFAGGGAIPLEAQRLGLEAHAHDLNPVAVMINKAMIEIPPKFAGMKPVNPEARAQMGSDLSPKGAAGLAEDVRYYGEWMKQEAFKKIGHLYPKVKTSDGKEATVIAWIWARTVKCPNPACGCEMPLINSFYMSKKKGKEAYVEPHYIGDKVSFIVKQGKSANPATEFGTKNRNEKGKASKAVFCCPKCGNGVVHGEYADQEGENGRMGAVPVCVVAEGSNGRMYLDFTAQNAEAMKQEVDDYYTANAIDEIVPHAKCRGTFASNAQGRYYGFHEFKDYFTNRQLTALCTFSELVGEAQKKAEADAVLAGRFDDHTSLSEGGTGARAYGEAVGVYLAFVVDKMADYHSAICSWHNSRELIRNTFGRQAIPMTWDYAEANPFCESSGSYGNMLEWVLWAIQQFPKSMRAGIAKQFDAQSNCNATDIMVSTDPPYYDNIGYADLSDYFYVWMRQALKNTYPKLFNTMLVPKTEELVATPYRFDGSMAKARDFFEDGMFKTCCQLHAYALDDIPVTIYYAFKQSESETENGKDEKTASTGWETMLSAIIRSGFAITGTWPMRTEMANRSIASGANALASSIVLVCRKRSEEARSVTRRDFINALHREMRPALLKLQSANIAPVDLAQSAIGPGIGVFSRCKSVLESDGKPMTVRAALQIINQELDAFYNEQEGTLDRESRFCVELYSQYAFNQLKFGDADILARAKNTSVQALAERGVLSAAKGTVSLKTREELPKKVDISEACIWLLTQQLAHIMEQEGVKGCAQVLAAMHGSNTEEAKALAYRLYTICERKNWSQEGYAYNNLVVAWPDIQVMAAQIAATKPVQLSLEDLLKGE